MIGEEYEVHNEDLMRCLEILEQHKEDILEASTNT